MLVGYARTPATERLAGVEAQCRDLKAAGCENVFKEQAPSIGERAGLERALESVREGDAFVVTKLDRLARSVRHLLELVDRLQAKGVALRILNMGLDTANPTGRLMLTTLGAVAEFEREMMLERQREGIAKAKSEGKFKGRAPTARAKAEDVRALAARNIGPSEIARRLNIGRTSVHRILNGGGAS